MAKVNSMATSDDRTELSNKIKSVKDSLGATYSQLNNRLGRPCNASTLQIRASYPGKPLSKKLLDKINDAIIQFETELKEEISKEEALSRIKEELMNDIQEAVERHTKKIEEYFNNINKKSK